MSNPLHIRKSIQIYEISNCFDFYLHPWIMLKKEFFLSITIWNNGINPFIEKETYAFIHTNYLSCISFTCNKMELTTKHFSCTSYKGRGFLISYDPIRILFLEVFAYCPYTLLKSYRMRYNFIYYSIILKILLIKINIIVCTYFYFKPFFFRRTASPTSWRWAPPAPKESVNSNIFIESS